MSDSAPKKATIPVRMSPDMQEKIAFVSEKTGLAQADVIRLSIGMGLEDLRRINYDIAGTLSRAANPEERESPESKPAPLRALPKVAEEGTKYKKGGKK